MTNHTFIHDSLIIPPSQMLIATLLESKCQGLSCTNGQILVSWDDYSQLYGKIKIMFQTTNQPFFISNQHFFPSPSLVSLAPAASLRRVPSAHFVVAPGRSQLDPTRAEVGESKVRHWCIMYIYYTQSVSKINHIHIDVKAVLYIYDIIYNMILYKI